jgi:hypothetical protein
MADLVVSFVRKRPPLKGSGSAADTLASWKATRGSGVRSLRMAIGSESVFSEFGANAKDDAVVLRAGAACWVAVGPETYVGSPPVLASPIAQVGFDASPAVVVGSHYMLENEVLELAVVEGEKIAVIAAA